MMMIRYQVLSSSDGDMSIPPRQASIMLLYDVMVVNNWQAFMDAYSRYTTE